MSSRTGSGILNGIWFVSAALSVSDRSDSALSVSDRYLSAESDGAASAWTNLEQSNEQRGMQDFDALPSCRDDNSTVTTPLLCYLLVVTTRHYTLRSQCRGAEGGAPPCPTNLSLSSSSARESLG